MKKSLNKFLKNKNGDVSDVPVFIFWLFFILVGILIIILIFLKVNQTFQSVPIFNDTIIIKNSLFSFEQHLIKTLPSGLLILLFGFIFGILFSSFFIRTHPIFLPIYIISSFFFILIGVVLGNFWGYFKNNQEILDIINLNSSLKIIDLILSNLVIFFIVIFCLSLLIIFAKPSLPEGEPY